MLQRMERLSGWRLCLALFVAGLALVLVPPQIFQGSENLAAFFLSLPVMAVGACTVLCAIGLGGWSFVSFISSSLKPSDEASK
jgi:hypothetical protein